MTNLQSSASPVASPYPNDILLSSWAEAEQVLKDGAPFVALPASFSPSLQAKVLEVAKNFSAGPSSEILHRAAQRLAESELMHQHAVSLVAKLQLVPYNDRRFLAMELQGLTAACELWELNVN